MTSRSLSNFSNSSIAAGAPATTQLLGPLTSDMDNSEPNMGRSSASDKRTESMAPCGKSSTSAARTAIRRSASSNENTPGKTGSHILTHAVTDDGVGLDPEGLQ